MKLFGKRTAEPPPPPVVAAPPPPALVPAPKHPETVSLKLALPDIFAFAKDETKSKHRRNGTTESALENKARGTILLVESDDEVCRLLARLLQHEGFAVCKVSCLAEARESLKEHPVDFLLARRSSVPANLQTEIALREVETKCTVRIVDDFSELMLGQVIDYQSLSACTLGLLELLTSLIEGANLGIRGHAHNVAKYSRLVGQRLGLSQRDLDALTMAALLHDLGAMGTNDDGDLSTKGTAGLLPGSVRPTLDLLANISFPYNITELLTATADHRAPEEDAAPPVEVPIGARVLRVVDGYETLRRTHPEFADEETLFAWMRQQPTRVFDTDVLETLIHIRKHERVISAMNIFWAAVLIVDPQPEEVQLLRLRLENADFHVLTARTIEEALQQLRTENITLVLSESTLLNKQTGFELLRTIKQDPQLRQIPFVFHAPGGTDLIKQALELGAEDWYPKPQNIEIVAMKLQRIVGRVHTRDSDNGSSDGVQGSLSEMGIIEMIQILSHGGRSLQINLEKGQQSGELVMHRGQLVRANLGQLEGEPAALELLRWREGRFRILSLKKTPQSNNLNVTTDNLLLRSCVHDDQRYQALTHPESDD